MLPSSTSVRIPFHPALPGTPLISILLKGSGFGWMWCTRDARESTARRKIEGLYSRSGSRTQTRVVDGDDLGCDDFSDPGIASAPYRGDGHVCGHRVDSFYYLFDDALNMMLVNASRVRNVPGRKTDLIRQQLGNHILGHRVQIALRC
jgi:hypothetical protein